MPRRRFVWDRDLKTLVEVPTDYEQPVRQDGSLWNDRHYENMQATDGTDISSRSKHREYMKRNGLTTADDFKGEWAKAAKNRADYYQGKGGGAVSRDDVGRAIHQLESAPRRRK
jgi:hypothetical protein